MNISALDEQGNPVDWWFIYKVPKLTPGPGTDGATGYEYVYYDSAIDSNPDVRQRVMGESKFVLNSDNGALNLTLDSVFKNYPNPPDATTGWILYNDEYPEKVGEPDDGSKGHTKGVLAFDTASKTGFCIAFQNTTLWSALSKSNLVLAPPGHSRTEATALIKATHDHAAENPAKTDTPAPSPGKSRLI